jgi:hypothetical protein
MTYADETRFHYFSLDSDQDLSAAVLALSTASPANWVVASHTAAPTSAGSFPAPQTGLTRYWWRALFGPGEVLTLTSDATLVSGHLTNAPEEVHPVWTVYSEDIDTAPPECWPVDTSCLGDTWEGYSAETQATAILLAVETLRALTAYRVGGCPVTVRPCLTQWPYIGTWLAFPAGAGWSSTTAWQPYYYAGQWTNIACGCPGVCTCLPDRRAQVTLEGVGRVTEVKVDGAVLDPTAWKVIDGNVLVRTDGGLWPTCQDLMLDDDQPDTFAVTYTPGANPGRLGGVAAGRLAGEYALLCEGRACRLPSNVRTVARNGVTLDLATEAWPNGLTGLRDVDVFIRRWNPHALRTASVSYNVDTMRRL